MRSLLFFGEDETMIKLFTHTDLDGISCEILARMVFPGISVSTCGYNQINQWITEMLENKEDEKYDYIFITDISVTEEVAQKLDAIKHKVRLFDHHDTASYLAKYEWAKVPPLAATKLDSGTSMFYRYLKEAHNLYETVATFTYVQMVTSYDTWQWATQVDKSPKDLNDLFAILERNEFVIRTITNLKKQRLGFSPEEKFLLSVEKRKIENYIKKKEKELQEYTLAIYETGKKYNVGIVMAEQYISELGNQLSVRNKKYDFIMIINGLSSVSLRTDNENIDLGGEVAHYFGGGGHAKAAGFPISSTKQEEILKICTKEETT